MKPTTKFFWAAAAALLLAGATHARDNERRFT